MKPSERIKMMAQAMEGMNQRDWELVKEALDKEFERKKQNVTLGNEEKVEEALTRKWEQDNRHLQTLRNYCGGARDIRLKLCEEPATQEE